MSAAKLIIEENVQTKVKKPCPDCGKLRSVFYRRDSKNRKHLATVCEDCTPHTQFVPMEDGLDIPFLREFEPETKFEKDKKAAEKIWDEKIVTKESRRCPNCGNLHNAFYRFDEGDNQHLVVICPNGSLTIEHIKMEQNLDIPFIGEFRNQNDREYPDRPTQSKLL